jgi:hypothetical protein
VGKERREKNGKPESLSAAVAAYRS